MKLKEYVSGYDWINRPEVDVQINDTKTIRRIRIVKEGHYFIINLYRLIGGREMFSFSHKSTKLDKLIEDFADWSVAI